TEARVTFGESYGERTIGARDGRNSADYPGNARFRDFRARDDARACRTEYFATGFASFAKRPSGSGPRVDCARMDSLRRRHRPLWRRRPRQVADRAAASNRDGDWLGLASC